MCCENPINLGCFNSCENVVTNVALVGLGTYTIKYDFNGSEIVIGFTTTGVGNFLHIPSKYFPEDIDLTFALYDNEGEYIGCYKFSNLPATLQLSTYTSIESVTDFSFVECVDFFINGVFTIDFGNFDRFQDGSIIYFTPTITKNPSASSSATLTAISSGISISGSTITVDDFSALPDDGKLVFEIAITNEDCLQTTNITGQVTGYDNLIDETKIGVQVPSNTYTYYAS